MAKPKKRTTYYEAICLRDGAIISAVPVRKRPKRLMDRDKQSIDEDNIIELWRTSGREYESADERRFRIFDLLTNHLNTRRNLRDMVLPRIQAIEDRLSRLETCLQRIEAKLDR